MTAFPGDDADDLSEDKISQIRAKLLADYKPASAVSGLDANEKKIAERILGVSEAERLGRTRTDQRYRYRKPVNTAEYWQNDSYTPYRAGLWNIDVFDNGKRRSFKEDLNEEQLKIVLDALKAKGIPVRLFETEAQKIERIRRENAPIQIKDGPCHKHKVTSGRRFILDKLKDFHL